MSGGRARSRSQSLDLERAREIFEDSQDFTIGLEEEFALVDPRQPRARAPLRGAVRAPAMDDEVLAESVAGELIDTEIEIRSGRAETFAEAIELPARAPPAAVRPRRAPRDRARRHRNPPVGQLPRPADHRHRALQPAARGAALGRAAQQHLEPARARRGPRRRPGDRRLRPPARRCCRRCWRCRRTRRSSTARTPACTRCAPRSSPAPSPAAACTSRSATGRPTPTSSTC